MLVEMWLLGIDGGGTQTRALIASADGRLLGVGRAGSSNYHSVGLEAAVAAVAEAADAAVAEAVAAAHVHGHAKAAFLGLAGVRSAADHQAFREPLAALGLTDASERLGLDHDLRIALAGGCAEGPGIVIIAGTGAAAYGRDPGGATAIVGGWGWLLDDQGSGVWLALRGLRAIMEATDGRGPRTRLEPAIFAELSVTSAREAMQWTMRADTARSQLASLAPVVLATAEDGDRVAQEIVAEGARQLGRLARALGETLEWPAGAAIPVVPAGGLLERRSYRDAVRTELAAADVRFALLDAPAPPVAGAVFLAAELAGAPLSAAARQRLATELATR